MRLKAKHWGNHWRINEAATIPYHSLRFKPWNTDDTAAVSLLQFGMKKIEAASPRLAPKNLPTGRGWEGAFWGPFFIFAADDIDEYKTGTYDAFTQHGVDTFQSQAGITRDGIAGMETLHRLDGILVAVEKLAPIGPPPP